MDSPAKPISKEEYDYLMNQSKMQETGRTVKCVFPTCDSVFWTDGSLKQHLTKYHKKSQKEKNEIFKRNSFEERKEISEKQERRKDMIKKAAIENKENVFNIQKTEDRDAKFLNKVAPRKHIQNDSKTIKVKDISKENSQKVSEPINTTFICMFCDTKFSNRDAHKQHVKNECGPEKWEDISKEKRRPKLMYEHKNRQKEPDPFETTICKFCYSNFPNKLSLQEHIQLDCKPEKCHFCDKTFRNKDSLLNHSAVHIQKNMKRNHQDQKDVQERTFKKPKIQEDQDMLLEVHEEKNHEKYLEENKPNSYCRICDKRFSNEWILLNHCAANHRPIVYEEKKPTKGQ